MPRAPCLFRESDMRRAIKAAVAAGLEIARVEIAKDGAIVVVPGKPCPGTGGGLNPWDEVLDNATDKERPS
jgi:hypothetical protein